MTSNSKNLQGKDLINIGIFAAVYFVVAMAIGMLGYIPVFVPLLCVIVPIFGGIPFMLFLTKAKKFGMIWIFAILLGLLSMLSGMSYYTPLLAVGLGLLADLIYCGEQKSVGKAILAHGVFSVIIWGNLLPILLNIDAYFSARADYGTEYVAALKALLPSSMFFISLAGAFISGIVGGFVGRALLKKHFIKAGITG